jgi:hypothetical protein
MAASLPCTTCVDKVDKVKGVEKEVVPGGGGGGGGTGGPQPKKQCKDGKDNDGDGKIDFGTGANNDPGCDSATDDSENVPPVAKDDELTTTAPDPEDINVILGGTMLNKDDDDTDADGHNLSVSEFTEPSHGTVERDATSNEILLYTPEDGFPSCTTNPCPDGTDSFDYTVSDGHGGTDTGTVHVTVYPPSGQ